MIRKKAVCCVICQKEINLKKDSYFKVDLYENGSFFGTDYSHKSCWHNRLNIENNVRQMIGATQNYLRKAGVLSEQEMDIASI